jgi:hypothetical protein
MIISTLSRAAAAAALVTLVAACGSSSSGPGSPSSGAARPGTVTLNGQAMSAAQANRDMVRFAACMRSHGASGLPDPSTSPRAFKQALATASPAFRTANKACSHLLPAGSGRGDTSTALSHAQLTAMVALARCMRGHGFARFPDPTSSGGVTHTMLANAGIDIHQPAFAHAADACVGTTHGLLTRTDVAKFIAGQ